MLALVHVFGQFWEVGKRPFGFGLRVAFLGNQDFSGEEAKVVFFFFFFWESSSAFRPFSKSF